MSSDSSLYKTKIREGVLGLTTGSTKDLTGLIIRAFLGDADGEWGSLGRRRNTLCCWGFLAGFFVFPLDFLPGFLTELFLGGGGVTDGLILALDRVAMTTTSLMVAKYLRGSRSVLRHTQATCVPPGDINL